MSSVTGPGPGPDASQAGLATRPEGRQGQPQAPSLDAIATQTDARDSRSSSSTNSPAPNEIEESDFYLGSNDSQSSLGVTNLQDMQVTDDINCLPPINRLPNEILISIFSRLSSPADQLRCMLTCKRWAKNTVDLLWHRPSCTSWEKHSMICQTLGQEAPYFAYPHFIKRLNLAALADKVNDGSVMPLSVCNRVERLTLTSCKGLTDSGLIALVKDNSHLLALDMSSVDQITDASILAIAEHCKRLQGLNVSGCTRISNDSMAVLAQSCRYIKRLKLNDCRQLGDTAIQAFAENCPNLLEIDLMQCRNVGNASITSVLSKALSLRELRLVFCDLIDDGAFLSLPNTRFENLRILDLTSCSALTDRAVEKIINVAPRVRNLVLSKCRNITDAAVHAIAELGKNLHYVHLGHCHNITDEAVKKLVAKCNRIRYIDLGCCTHLTDDSVTQLATLPKLKRIGLVKCSGITDESIFALARANQYLRPRQDAQGNPIRSSYRSHSSLERVHLSYCTNLTLKGIIKLLNSCPRLTHLSLTGVQAFLREDLSAFCRDAPPEFTEHQRNVFLVFSGDGVKNLRRYLTNSPNFADLHENRGPAFQNRRHSLPGGGPFVPGTNHLQAALDASFDAEEQEPDAIDDDDGMEDGDGMVVDAQPFVNNNMPLNPGIPTFTHYALTGVAGPSQPPPPPPAPGAPGQQFAPGGVFPGVGFGGVGYNHQPFIIPLDNNAPTPPYSHGATLEAGLAGPSAGISGSGASAAHTGAHTHGDLGISTSSTAPIARQSASGAESIGSSAGPSTAPLQGIAGLASIREDAPSELPDTEGSPTSSSGNSPPHA